MATLTRRLPANVPGDFYVDSSCIDCDACRWIAPQTFDESGDQSRVHRQPKSADELRRAEMALIACPTGSIGTTKRHDLKGALAAYPDLLAKNVYHCGFHSERSFGAATWFVTRPQGNVLIDSPRFSAPLVKRLEELGGVKTLFLSHGDDVADHAKFHEHFHCDRVLHEGDLSSGTRDVEIVLEGLEPRCLDEEILAIPTPGHTRGSACLLYNNEFLFTGDHLAWSERLGHLYAFRDACWYDWDVLRESMQRLKQYRFEWVLPGHGRMQHLPAEEMARSLAKCVEWMER